MPTDLPIGSAIYGKNMLQSLEGCRWDPLATNSVVLSMLQDAQVITDTTTL
jgi:hypothetical protein